MQSAAPEALDIARETKETQELYGVGRPECDHVARQCLAARRLVERGVRFVQIYSGGMENERSWDGHIDIKGNHEQFAGETDRPVAALLTDLQRRGLLDSTLVVWAGEFGRLPVSQKGAKPGRDHNPHANTAWLAGGGVKGGVSYGETDEFGYKAAVDRADTHDFHATLLHLLGHRPREADVPAQRPPLPADRRGRQGDPRDRGVVHGERGARPSVSSHQEETGGSCPPLAFRHFSVVRYSTKSRTSRGLRVLSTAGIGESGAVRPSMSATGTASCFPSGVWIVTAFASSATSVPATTRPSARVSVTAAKPGAIFALGASSDSRKNSRVFSGVAGGHFRQVRAGVPAGAVDRVAPHALGRGVGEEHLPPAIRVPAAEADGEGAVRPRRQRRLERGAGLVPARGLRRGQGVEGVELQGRRHAAGRELVGPGVEHVAGVPVFSRARAATARWRSTVAASPSSSTAARSSTAFAGSVAAS